MDSKVIRLSMVLSEPYYAGSWCSLSRQLPRRRPSQNHWIDIYMGTGYVTQVLEIVLAAAGNEIERAVALKQTGSNNCIAERLEDCQIGASLTKEIPVVGNVAYRPLNSDWYFVRRPVQVILLCMIVRPSRRNIDTAEMATKSSCISVGKCGCYL